MILFMHGCERRVFRNIIFRLIVSIGINGRIYVRLIFTDSHNGIPERGLDHLRCWWFSDAGN